MLTPLKCVEALVLKLATGEESPDCTQRHNKIKLISQTIQLLQGSIIENLDLSLLDVN
jgi:hypothetical protein